MKKKLGDKRQRTAPHSRGEETLGQEEIAFVEEKLLFNQGFLPFFPPSMGTNANANAPHRTAEERKSWVKRKLLLSKGNCFSM